MATQAHCAYCFESLSASLEKRPQLPLADVEALWSKYTSASSAPKPAAISRLTAGSPETASSSSVASAASSSTSISSVDTASPLFVTWNTLGGGSRGDEDKRLRGCIGTFEAQELDAGLRDYALTSAFHDTRFNPISARELPSLECAVTLLTHFEPASSPTDWTLGTHGIRLSFEHKGRRYGATYLPDVAVEQGWSKEETLVSLMRKAGWNGKREDWRTVGLRVVRYQGKKVELGYAEWRAWRDWVDDEDEEDEDGEEE